MRVYENTYEIVVTSVYPSMTLQFKALACDRTSMRNSFHQESLVSGSSGFGTRSSSFTDLEHTVAPVICQTINVLHSFVKRRVYLNVE